MQCRSQVSNIDGGQKFVWIEQGKCRKDRYVILAPPLLDLLRAWWKDARTQSWLIPELNPVNPPTAKDAICLEKLGNSRPYVRNGLKETPYGTTGI